MIYYNFTGETKHTIMNYYKEIKKIVINISYEDYEGSSIKTVVLTNIKDLEVNIKNREIMIEQFIVNLNNDIKSNPDIPEYIHEMLVNKIRNL